ncbi:MAG TPA: hypothetical protein VFV19_16965 [Candidatus Polarisedimenticolaceae bacterium]|nr:hypothetical protein [Candidatus Polarisedimenticolaceae bacterium]
MFKKIVAGCTVALAVAAIGAGVMSMSSTPVEAKICGRCPAYCIGVTCDDGKTYCNSCYAACAGAGHCVITG